MRITRDLYPGSAGATSGEYEAVRKSVGVVRRSDLSLLRMWGRDPARMLNGLITNDLKGLADDRSLYAAILTPKGRMISDLRAVMRSTGSGPELVMVIPTVAVAPVGAHLTRYVPPMFAKWSEEEASVIGVYGPESAGAVEEILGATVGVEDGDVSIGTFEGREIVALATRFTGEVGFDVLSPADVVEPLLDALVAAAEKRGGRAVEAEAIETARIEAGRPVFGVDMTDESLPAEVYPGDDALRRMVSFTKGCYTGQEVVVRIAHRGHVNRRIVGLLLGGSEPPAPRTALFGEGDRAVGWTTSAVISPGVGKTIALAMVRREIEPGSVVHLTSPDGPPGRITTLPFV